MKVAIIGAGNMGLAFARGMLAKKIIASQDLILYEADTIKHATLRDEFGTEIFSVANQALIKAEIIILAIKPQDFKNFAQSILPFLQSKHLVISIMAGQTLETLQNNLSGHKLIVRAMPNLAAQVGSSYTAYVANAALNKEQLQIAAEVLGSVGFVEKFDNEAMINPVTALASSGSGYVFYFLENMCKVASEMGFSDIQTKDLLIQTFKGALSVWENSNDSVENLRKRVCSKGGGTEAAIIVFEESKVGQGIQEGIRAANRRYIELG